MLYTAIACTIVATAANKAEVTTNNLRSGASFDNLKASWGKALSFGDFKTQLDCSYDRNECKDFLTSATLTGNLIDDDVSVDYEVKKNFQGAKSTEVKLTAAMDGTKVTAEVDSDANLKEVSAQRVVTVGDRDVDLQPSFLVKTQTARLKLMSAFGKDKVKAQVDYSDGSAGSYELGYERDMADGKVLSATLVPADKNLEIELVDSEFESGATWTATANVPYGDSDSIIDNAKLSLKRAWSW